MSKIYTFNYLGFAALFNLTGKNFSYHSKWDINLLSLHILRDAVEFLRGFIVMQ